MLWLAADHLHVCVKSDGEKSIEAAVEVLKRVSAESLLDASILGDGPSQ